MSRTPTKAVQMAYLTIGQSSFLLDASKAMKVAELMQHAVAGEWDYYRSDREDTYTAGEPARVEFRLIRSDQVHMPQGAPVSMSMPRARQRLLK